MFIPIVYIVYSCIFIWVNYNDLTVLPSLEIMVYFRGIIPFYGRTIQVSEILLFTQIYQQQNSGTSLWEKHIEIVFVWYGK